MCPACGRDLLSGAQECHGCGVILAKYRPRNPKPARPAPAQSPRPRRRRSPVRSVVLGLFLGLVATVAYYYVEQARPGRPWDATARHDPVSDFDLELALDANPGGLAWNGDSFLMGNRDDPWGFVEIVPDEDDERRFTLRRRPVVETFNAQRINLRAVTWNGEAFVGYTDGGWFRLHGTQVFTFHDPQTLEVTRHVKTPVDIGCLAFDGTSYWAASRRNTEYADEPAWLYKLDAGLRVVERYEPPGVGCQGLAWDGEKLWFADVFSEKIYALEVFGVPRVVRSYGTRFDYLSGLAFDGENLWAVEYGDNRLLRLNPRLRMAWERTTLRAWAAAGLRGAAFVGELSPLEQALQGVWLGHEVSSGREWTVLIEGRRYFVKGPGQRNWFKGTFEVDPQEVPVTIDFKVRECDCSYKGEVIRAIYRLERHRLTLAAGAPGGERPPAFSGAGGRVLELER